MYVPHHRFLHYLGSLGHPSDRIAELCAELDLPLPAPHVHDEPFLRIYFRSSPHAQDLPFWQHRLTRTNLGMRRWLSSLEVLPLWEDRVLAQTLAEVLHHPNARIEVESLLLQGRDHEFISNSVQSMGVYFPEASVAAYSTYLWDLSGMGFSEWHFYFANRWCPVLQDIVRRQQEHLRARFDSETEDTDSLDAVVALRAMVLRKVKAMSRQTLSGQETLAMANLGKVALEALSREEDLRKARVEGDKPEEFDSLVDQYQAQLQQAEVQAETHLVTWEQLSSDGEGGPVAVQGA